MTDFRVSSFCGNGGCVEVAITPGNVQVRGTGQDDALDFTHAEWRAFTAGVRAGEFDLPQAPGDADADITDRLEVGTLDARLTFTRDERGVSLSVGQCPDRSVSVRLPDPEWQRIRAWLGEGDAAMEFCPACGHAADHSGGQCMWVTDYNDAEGYSHQRACSCAPDVLVARCENYREDVDAPCAGRIRYRWGQTQAACDTCGGYCGVAVAAWERVEPAAPAVPAAQRTFAVPQDALEDALQCAWNEWVGDTGSIPDEFSIAGPKTTRVTADFRRGTFARRVLAHLPTGAAAAVPAGPGDTVPRAPVQALLDALAEQLDGVWIEALAAAVDEVQRHLDATTNPPEEG